MNRTRRLWRSPITRLVTMAAVLVMLLGFAGYTSRTTAHAAGNNACQLDSAQGNIKHVINIQFDNVHFTRDNPNVPSDLEQMPNLLNFITNNGVLLSNHHTPLIAHTATDILTSLTGVYGDRHGVPISNSFRYFNPDGTSNTGVSFAYWTAPLFDPNTSTPTDTTYNMLTASGKNAPAPWVPYTRAGCNVGSVATAN
ncbi:MAG: alkaline phosphatase family protein, partial [Chloroflexi bacterium]